MQDIKKKQDNKNSESTTKERKYKKKIKIHKIPI